MPTDVLGQAIRDAIREAVREVVREAVREEIASLRIANVTKPAPPTAGAPSAEYITDVELAAWLGMSRETLQQQRSRGEGPPYVKAGKRAVRYHVPAVREWLDARVRGAK